MISRIKRHPKAAVAVAVGLGLLVGVRIAISAAVADVDTERSVRLWYLASLLALAVLFVAVRAWRKKTVQRIGHGLVN